MQSTLSQRIFVIISIFFIIIFFLAFSKKNIKIIRDFLVETAKKEILFPFAVLVIVLFFENVTNIIDGSFSLDSNFNNHFLYEFILIYIIYLLILLFRIVKKRKIENKEEIDFWMKYKNALKRCNEEIIALNVRDYNLFSEPLGTRYIFEQINHVIYNKMSNTKIPICCRIIAINAKNKSGILNSKELEACKEEKDGLDIDQKNFYNVYLLHKWFNIKLFLVPKRQLMREFTCLGLKRFRRKHFFEKDLDRLIIDKVNWHPTAKGNSLKFEPDLNRINTYEVNRIISKYCEDEWDIENLLNYQSQQKK